MRRLLLVSVMLLGGANTARASFVANFSQVGPNVVATGTGSLNTTIATQFSQVNFRGGYVYPDASRLALGPTGFVPGTQYVINLLTTFKFFGSGSGGFADTGSGDLVSFLPQLGNLTLLVPVGYVSGTVLSDKSTWLNSSFATLGLTPGTYNYVYGRSNTSVTDTFTIQIGSAVTPTSVVEPTSMSLLGLSLGGIAVMRRRRVG